MNEDKINVYCTILAYTQGSWTPEEVEKAYTFIVSKAKVANMHLVSAEDTENTPEAH